MNLSQNFTLEELTYSRTAVENGLENIPSPRALQALKNLSVYLLQPLRDRYGKTIAITSSYRNETVNLLIGGVKNSQHTKGEAADCYIAEGPETLLEILKASGLTFDQAILYRRKKFLHLSYREGFNRMKILLYLLSIVFLTNCTASKQTSTFREQTDSLRQTAHLSVQTMKIPESRARLAIPSATLKELPVGAAFVRKSGQATAEIRFLHDTLFVTATCDSLQNLVYQYETAIEQTSRHTTKKETVKQKSPIYSNMTILILAIGIIIYTLLKREHK